MQAYDRSPSINTSKRFPIVFCLDVSPSMGARKGHNSSSIELLNAVVRNLIEKLRQDFRIRASAEVAFVTFSTNIEMDTEFQSIGALKTPTFSPSSSGGTRTAQAVLRSIDKIEQRRKQLADNEIAYYAPLLVLITCGDPDHNDDLTQLNKAKSKIIEHCSQNIRIGNSIVPFVVFLKSANDTDPIINFLAECANYPIFEIDKDNLCNASIDDVFGKLIRYIRHCDLGKCSNCDDRWGNWCPIYLNRDIRSEKAFVHDLTESRKELSDGE